MTVPKRKLNPPSVKTAERLPVTLEGLENPDSLIDPKSALDRRIVTAPVEELPSLLQARGAIIQQNEWENERVHGRIVEKRILNSRIGFSVLAGLGGGAMIVGGFILPGLFLLGGTASIFVPQFVKDTFNKIGIGGPHAE